MRVSVWICDAHDDDHGPCWNPPPPQTASYQCCYFVVVVVGTTGLNDTQNARFHDGGIGDHQPHVIAGQSQHDPSVDLIKERGLTGHIRHVGMLPFVSSSESGRSG